MQIREASEKWNISERRIRQLIQDGRIEGAEKIGTTWNIPDDTNKPIDKRVKDEIEFKIDLPEDYFKDYGNTFKIKDSEYKGIIEELGLNDLNDIVLETKNDFDKVVDSLLDIKLEREVAKQR